MNQPVFKPGLNKFNVFLFNCQRKCLKGAFNESGVFGEFVWFMQYGEIMKFA